MSMLPAIVRFTCFCALLTAALPSATALESVQLALTQESSVAFASREQGSAIMACRDAYISRMSSFDRMLRLQSTHAVSEREHLEFLAANVLEWTDAEKARLTPIVQKLQTAAQGYRLPLPSTVLLVKTTGREEVGQGHTRANAIVLPERSLGINDKALLLLLAHELFHVISRHDAEFRQQAYRLIGFRIGDEISLPAAIAPLQITNPDAPRHDSYIDVSRDGRKITVIPVLLSRSAVFDPQIGDQLDQYWTLRLMVIEQATTGDDQRVMERNGVPILLKLSQVEGFFEQVGNNTRYVIHAEEILAENFALMVSGAAVPEPQRLDALRQLLARH